MDKSGIYVCLKLLEALPAIKVVFFSREETGGVGSRNFDTSFLSDCRFIGGVDRRGIEDFVTSHAGKTTVSKDFLKVVKPIMDKYGRKESVGAFTDAFNLKLDICRFNMSAAYYKSHSSQEIVKVDELEQTYNFCLEIAKKCVDVYPHVATSTYVNNNFNNWHNTKDDDWFDDYGNYKRSSRNKTRSLFKDDQGKALGHLEPIDSDIPKETEWERLVKEQDEEWERYYNNRNFQD